MYKKRRSIAVFITLISLLAGIGFEALNKPAYEAPATLGVATVVDIVQPTSQLAADALEQLAVKGRAPKTGYERSKFSDGWGELGGCSTRELILQRDLVDEVISEDGCRVASGILDDPYTGQKIMFTRGQSTSSAVQIDHVVAVSDAWQKGAQLLSPELRYQFYNDPLNLLAVDGPTNNKKGDGDAATWLPPNKDYRCRYVARQVAVKIKYSLWVTAAEKDSVRSVLGMCPGQLLPVVGA